jgi:hypothetical protein
VQLGRAEAAQAKDDAHLVREGLGPEEDDALVLDCPSAEGEKQRGPRAAVRHVLLADADKLLDEVLGRLAGRVDKEPDGLVEREPDELVDRVAHRRREEHRLPPARAGGDDLVELV